MNTKPNDWFHKLVEIHYHSVLNFSVHMLKNRLDAQELTQDVFLKVLKAGEAKMREGSERAYLLTIARNAALDKLMQQTRKYVNYSSLDEIKEPPITEHELCSPDSQAQIQNLLDGLNAWAVISAKDNEVLKLWLEGCDFEEIGKMLEIPKATAYKRYQRILEKLYPLAVSGEIYKHVEY